MISICYLFDFIKIWQTEYWPHRRADEQTNGRCLILFSPAVSLPCGLCSCSLPIPESLGSVRAGQMSTSSRVHLFSPLTGPWSQCIQADLRAGFDEQLQLSPRLFQPQLASLISFDPQREMMCISCSPKTLSVAQFIHTEMPPHTNSNLKVHYVINKTTGLLRSGCRPAWSKIVRI